IMTSVLSIVFFEIRVLCVFQGEFSYFVVFFPVPLPVCRLLSQCLLLSDGQEMALLVPLGSCLVPVTSYFPTLLRTITFFSLTHYNLQVNIGIILVSNIVNNHDNNSDYHLFRSMIHFLLRVSILYNAHTP
ncbi:hypothetical protein L9F63_008463, partial [Diploptera punctata]